ncbi:MAG: histidine phosphatase family protein [Acidimicrobiales bacterium]|nr:histidine phosphatase family protein [Acidimicrobiales bacterium]
MELLLIRHALPVRVEREDGGAADPPLAELGSAQARRMAAWLAPERLHALYVSPLQRARQTAQSLAEVSGLEPVVVDGVAEYDRHDSVYIPIEDLRAARDDKDAERWKALIADTISDERKRWRDEVVASMEEIVGRHRGHNVAVVCHGGVINAYVTHVLGVEKPMVYEPKYTSVNRIVAASSGERSVLTLNEAPWLRELPTVTPTRR